MQSFGDAAGNIASRGLRAMAAGMGAATAAAAAQDKQWVALSATILASFAAGGPWAGAIALIGAGVGVMVSKSNEAAKAWEENMKRIAAATEKAAADVRSAQEAMFVQEGGTRGLFRLDEVDRRIAELGTKMMNAPWSESAEDSGNRIREFFAEQEHRSKLVDLVRIEAEQIGKQVVLDTHLLQITDERLRKEAEIRAERDRLVSTFERMQEAGIEPPEGTGWDTLIAFTNKRAELMIDQLPAKLEKVSQAWLTVGDTAFAVLDGILVRGGKTSDVIEGVLRSLGSMGLRMGIDAAIAGVARP